MGIVCWEDLNWVEIREAAHRSVLAIQPIGSIEQHGTHLPVGTDSMILQGLCRGLLEEWGNTTEFEALLLPMVSFGKSSEHMDFPGTVSLRADTVIKLVGDVVESLSQHGFQHLVMLNSHGGNTALLRAISHDLSRDFSLDVFNIDLWGTDFFKGIFPLLEGDTSIEIHAGEIETSLLMYLRPELVRNPAVVGRPREYSADPMCGFSGLASVGWRTRRISDSGVIGDPTLSTAEKGEAIYRHSVGLLARMLSAIYRQSRES